MKPENARVTNYGYPDKGRRQTSCLLWALVAFFCLLAALAVVVIAAYAGWTSGVGTARAKATDAADAELQGQCDLLEQNLADGNLDLARSRIDWLRRLMPVPSCLLTLAPTATAAHLQAQPSATSIPPKTAVPIMTETVPAQVGELPTSEVSTEVLWDYDLDALLAEAVADHAARNYSAAIQTLEAIVSIDEDFQRERVRRMLLDALTAQALTLYRSFKLSEAIVLTERAEVYGDIGELNYERYIADTFLIGQRSKATNPAEAVRRFSEIVYQHNPNYMNGQVQSELQDALRYFADALLLQGDACQAHEQYAAALALQPSYSLVSRGLLTTKQQEAAQTCGALNPAAAGQAGATSAGTPLPLGVRPTARGG
ncbi:MAG: hypothetical protein OXG78_13180 [Chloroflexi bacterium]|nr:hypothetical protein [Chloroflexota bacterium]